MFATSFGNQRLDFGRCWRYLVGGSYIEAGTVKFQINASQHYKSNNHGSWSSKETSNDSRKYQCNQLFTRRTFAIRQMKSTLNEETELLDEKLSWHCLNSCSAISPGLSWPLEGSSLQVDQFHAYTRNVCIIGNVFHTVAGAWTLFLRLGHLIRTFFYLHNFQNERLRRKRFTVFFFEIKELRIFRLLIWMCYLLLDMGMSTLVPPSVVPSPSRTVIPPTVVHPTVVPPDPDSGPPINYRGGTTVVKITTVVPPLNFIQVEGGPLSGFSRK